MKFSARLVTALAAVTLLVGAIVGLSTRAQAATSVPVTDTAVVQVYQVDLPGAQEEGGGADLAFIQTDVATTFDEAATPLMAFTMDRDVGMVDTALTLAVGQTDDLAAPEVAALISTGTEGGTTTPIAAIATGLLVGITATTVGTRHYLASRRSRQSGRAHAPRQADAAGKGVDDIKGTTQGGTDTTSYHPRA